MVAKNYAVHIRTESQKVVNQISPVSSNPKVMETSNRLLVPDQPNPDPEPKYNDKIVEDEISDETTSFLKNQTSPNRNSTSNANTNKTSMDHKLGKFKVFFFVSIFLSFCFSFCFVSQNDHQNASSISSDQMFGQSDVT